MPRLLANENVPRAAVLALRAAGHDVAWVRELQPGITDAQVLAWSVREQRVLLTFDRDFGQLAFAAGLDVSSGVILCRLATPDAHRVAEALVAALAVAVDWHGHFTVIEPDRMRSVRLPRSGAS